MSQYYCLIAGLPNISLDDSKIPFSLSEFRNELDGILTDADKALIHLFFLKFDNQNLIAQLNLPDSDFDDKGSITFDEFQEFITVLKGEDRPPANKKIRAYFVDFVRLYLAAQEADEKTAVSWEDRLTTMYYNYAIECSNQFVSAWFELNLNINNVLTAITCRKYGMEKADYIIGNNETAENLRTSNARDFGLGNNMEYLPDVQRIAEETDLLSREKKIDVLKWQWLEENTFFKSFSVESVFAYVIRLEMIERWTTLDRTLGEKTFRELIGEMKTGSNHALNEFKRNNK